MKWNASLYDNKHDFVSKYGRQLIEMLHPRPGEEILDVGCGTGDLAEEIRLSGAHVTAIDSSPEMIDAGRKKYPFIDFRLLSVIDIPFSSQFDGVFSNAALHWVTEKEKAAAQIFKALKPGGRFVAEMGGKGNISHIWSALKKSLAENGFTDRSEKQIWYFPSVGEYASVLERQGFQVTFAALFDRETPLADENGITNWLQMFARPYLEHLKDSEVKKILAETEKTLRATNYHDSQWYADYKRLRLVGVKVS